MDFGAFSRQWMMRTMKMDSSLSRDFAILSGLIVFIVFLLAVWLTWEVYQEESDKALSRLTAEATRIDSVLSNAIDNTSYLVTSLGRQIKLIGVGDPQRIARTLQTFDTQPDTYGAFVWVNDRQRLAISSNRGIIDDKDNIATDVSDRKYQRKAMSHPWKVHIGEPIEGRVSQKWVLPIVMGITDDTGRYMGTLVISLDLDGLTHHIDRALTEKGLSYALLGEDLILLGNGSTGAPLLQMNIPDQERGLLRARMTQKERLEDAPFVINKDLYAFYTHSRYFPYFIVIGYERQFVTDAIIKGLLPKLMQLAVTTFFLLAILWFMRHRVITPVVEISRRAAQISQGRQDVDIGLSGPAEITNLALQIQRVKDYVDERRRVEEELRRKNIALKDAKEASEMADRSKSEFLTCISHELRTPLNAIIGFSDVMKNEYFGKVGNEKYMQYIEDIYVSGQHLLELINDILDLAKVEAGAMTLNEEETDVRAIIDKCMHLLHERANSAGVIVSSDVDEHLPPLFADPLRLKQVLLNLLSNALKFTPKGGNVHIAAHYDAHSAQPFILSVADTGIGMAPEQIPIAMSKFGQVGAQSAKEIEGTGLGLPLTRELVMLHQGDMKIESEEGQGTTVTVTFPAARVIARKMRA